MSLWYCISLRVMGELPHRLQQAEGIIICIIFLCERNFPFNLPKKTKLCAIVVFQHKGSYHLHNMTSNKVVKILLTIKDFCFVGITIVSRRFCKSINKVVFKWVLYYRRKTFWDVLCQLIWIYHANSVTMLLIAIALDTCFFNCSFYFWHINFCLW